MDLKKLIQCLDDSEVIELHDHLVDVIEMYRDRELLRTQKKPIKEWLQAKQGVSLRLQNILLKNTRYTSRVPFDYLEDITLYDFKRVRGVGKTLMMELSNILRKDTTISRTGKIWDDRSGRFRN
ncbi:MULTISPECIES: hypothetical protein [Flavobacteriaceae]|jgi:hypothetical protein|uniref:Uncharacterized protein n=3 Tax=Flavobacteriaceae TaxID=49546 RepID=A0A223VBY8_9FLAO|nr:MULTISPECIES: hypothetical protein [Flavobacteriaceae]ASV32359.1 hypothetical protein CJ263_20180 [Maribacter cobaltidurans]MDC6388706.1 hypothetical protein [Maribacter sp. PR1]MEE1976095.1 hypothetical protein [Maribacter cobaltidurans]RIV68967.1 hypothetical protein D2U88_17550 [Allomuricauda aequoris]TXK00676.1 hypothetical protein FQ019_17345 [Allomuricauda aequoris]